MAEIEVECYAGYRGDEEPRSLVIDGRRLLVQEIVRRWRDVNGRRFRVRCKDGREYDLSHDESTGLWTEIGRA